MVKNNRFFTCRLSVAGRLKETEHSYGRPVRSIADNIVYDRETASERANDTWLAVWNKKKYIIVQQDEPEKADRKGHIRKLR